MVDKKTYVVEYKLDSDTRGAKKAEKATEELREETEKLGRAFKDVEADADSLDDKLEALGEHRLDLARRLSENDDVELRKEFSRTNQRIGFLTKLRKVITEGAPKAATSAAGTAFDLGGQGIKPRNAAYGGIAALAATATVPVGAALSGLLSGTAVGAAMAGGILSSINDPRVKAAASKFGDSIAAEFFRGGAAFVAPVEQSLDILGQAFRDLDLGDAFAKVAPQVTEVAAGIGNMARNTMPGFNKLLDRAGPFTEAFADGLSAMGKSLSDFFDEISSSEGAVEGLQAAMMLFNGTVLTLGNSLNVLSDIFDFAVDANARWLGILEDIPGQAWWAKGLQDTFQKIGDASKGSSGKVFDWARAAFGAARAAGELAGAITALDSAYRTYFEINMDVDRAQLNLQETWFDFRKTLKETNGDWSTTTENGLRARDSLLDMVEAADKAREAAIAQGGGTQEAIDKANAAFDRELDKIEQTIGKSKDAKAAFEDLAGEYRVKIYYEVVGAALQGATNFVKNAFKVFGFAHGGTTPASTGGNFRPFYTHPGEVMWDDKQHYVSTKAQTEALSRSGGGSGGGGQVTLTVMPGGSDAFTRALVEMISRYVRVSGGNAATLGIAR